VTGMHMRIRIQEQQEETSPSYRQAKTLSADDEDFNLMEEGTQAAGQLTRTRHWSQLILQCVSF
jgi:hypothetical protein